MSRNWIKETTTTIGAGSITLAGAVSGFRPFSGEFVDGDPVPYQILDVNGVDREAGWGVLSSSGTVLSRVPTETFEGGTYDGSAPSAITLSATGSSVSIGAVDDMFSINPPGRANTDRIVSAHILQDDINENVTLIADRHYMCPFLLLEPVTVTKYGIYLQTGVDSSVTRVGLAKMDRGAISDATFLINELIATELADDGAVTEATISALDLSPGWYAAHILSDAAIVPGGPGVSKVLAFPFPKVNTTARLYPASYRYTAAVSVSGTFDSPETVTTVTTNSKVVAHYLAE